MGMLKHLERASDEVESKTAGKGIIKLLPKRPVAEEQHEQSIASAELSQAEINQLVSDALIEQFNAKIQQASTEQLNFIFDLLEKKRAQSDSDWTIEYVKKWQSVKQELSKRKEYSNLPPELQGKSLEDLRLMEAELRRQQKEQPLDFDKEKGQLLYNLQERIMNIVRASA